MTPKEKYEAALRVARDAYRAAELASMQASMKAQAEADEIYHAAARKAREEYEAAEAAERIGDVD